MSVTVEELASDELDAALPALAEVLQACVREGASVGFVLPFPIADARAFWDGLAPAFRRGARRLLVARDAGAIVGTVQLVLEMPPNGRHRADVAKMLVHPAARRRGIGRLLMDAAEALARRHGRTLLVLDTVRGSPAVSLYQSAGFALCGYIPDYACSTEGVLETTTVMYKRL